MENTEGSVIEYILLDLLQRTAITSTIAVSSENMTIYIHNLHNWFIWKKEQDILRRDQPPMGACVNKTFDFENVLPIAVSSENAVELKQL